MPHERSKRLKEKIKAKRQAEQVKQARAERKRIEKFRRAKRRAGKPVRGAKRVGGEIKEAGGELRKAGKETGKLIKAKTPGVSSFKRRGSSTKPKSRAADSSDSALDTDRERKIVLAQQLRNEGLTLAQVGDQIGMSASWVSTNTIAPTGGSSTKSGDTGGGFFDDLSDTFESIEGDIFGGGSDMGDIDKQLGSEIDESLDKQLEGIDEQLGMEDGDFDIDLDGLD